MVMNQEQTDKVLQAWSESAHYWQKHHATIRVMFAPITRAIIEDAHIAQGQSVLDVAGGTGEPSLTIAEVVGPSGSVTCTDVVAEMVAAAEREAGRLGLANVTFRQCPADALPFASNAFDAVVCRLGVMFFPDPVAGLREMLRTVKPGGCVSLAVWRGKEFNPFLQAASDVLARYIEMAPEDPDAPGAFRFVASGKLARVVEQAGATDVRERILQFQVQAPVSLEEFWALRSEMSDTLRGKLATLSVEHLRRVAEETQDAAREYFPDNRMNFPAQAIIVSGRKPASGHVEGDG
jgi:ubiquinone/menaquinone biosynthesis C-methylase UbiE